MKCITYGTVVLLMIIISMIVAIIFKTKLDGVADKSKSISLMDLKSSAGTGMTVLGVSWFALIVWWFIGMFSDCEDGFFMAPRLKKEPKYQKYQELQESKESA